MARFMNYLNNITVKLTITLFVICIPITVISISSIYHSRSTLVENIKASHISVLQTYIQQIDSEIKNARNYTNSLTFNNPITLPLTIDNTSSDFYYSGNKLKNNVQSTLINYRYLNGLFIYVPNTDFYFTQFNDNRSLKDRDEFKEFLTTSVMPVFEKNTYWLDYNFQNRDYLIQGFYRNGIYAGCLININAININTSFGENISFIPYSELNDIETDLSNDSILLYQKSSISELCVYEIMDTGLIFSELPVLQKYIMLFSIFIILLVPILYLTLVKIIIHPLKNLEKAMLEIQSGNPNYRIKNFNYANEFNQINTTFNDMVHQLQELKITVYEEKINSQKSRLNNLQIQLRPHFMVNSLNMVYNLITNKNYNDSLNLIRFSIKYLRYMLKIKEDFVPLNEELEHIKNYLNIQLLRYSNNFSYQMEIDPFIETVPVPPLLIQNFIENSLKYSISPNKKAEIVLRINYEEKNLQSYIYISIHDNGSGYPEELLEPLNNQEIEALTNSVGLRNSIERIKILYDGEAYLHFYNDNGAVNEFLFPMK